MPKALCIIAMAISILVLILFVSDLLLGVAGLKAIAPFKGASIVIDLIFYGVCRRDRFLELDDIQRAGLTAPGSFSLATAANCQASRFFLGSLGFRLRILLR